MISRLRRPLPRLAGLLRSSSGVYSGGVSDHRLSSSAIISSSRHSYRNHLRPKTKTPLELQFETWTEKLRPGFTSADVDTVLHAQADPDLALDIFRWTSRQRNYKHDHITYYTIIKILIHRGRSRNAETLIEEVISGACEMNINLYHLIIRFFCSRKVFFHKAFDVYKKMLKSENCKPTLETYSMLLNLLLKRFGKMNVNYVYLQAVKSLWKQLKSLAIIPDTFVYNMVIKAHALCLDVDEAIRVFDEMGSHGCAPNLYSYSYVIKALCEKGKTGEGLSFFEEMRRKKLVPTPSCYMVLICSLALSKDFETAIDAVSDMLGSFMRPDILTYKTVLEALCNEKSGDEAMDLLEQWRKMDGSMNEKGYKTLLDVLQS